MIKRTFLSVVILGVLLLASSCSLIRNLGDFQRRVGNGIEQECGRPAECRIKLGDYTDFRWDTLYVFDEATDDELITRVLGKPLAGWEEMTCYEVFLLDGKIVHQEHFEVDFEKPMSREVLFYHATDKQFSIWKPQQSVAVRIARHTPTQFEVGDWPR